MYVLHNLEIQNLFFCHRIPKKRTVLQFSEIKVVSNVIEISKASFTFLFYVKIRDDLIEIIQHDR